MPEFIWTCRHCGAQFSSYQNIPVIARACEHLRKAHAVELPIFEVMGQLEKWLTPDA